jgi:hypothetical protein
MTYHTLALGTLVYEKKSHHNTYPKIQESYETTYTYPTLKYKTFVISIPRCSTFPRNFQKPGLSCMHFTTYPCNTGPDTFSRGRGWNFLFNLPSNLMMILVKKPSPHPPLLEIRLRNSPDIQIIKPINPWLCSS